MALRKKAAAAIPYPPVFRDWRPDVDHRVSTGTAAGGIIVEMGYNDRAHGFIWRRAELTEDDACLLAASLLERVARERPQYGELSQRILREMAR